FRQPYSGNHVSRGVEDRKCFLREGVKVDNGDLLSRNERESQSPAGPRFTPATGSFAARAITPAASSRAWSARATQTFVSDHPRLSMFAIARILALSSGLRSFAKNLEPTNPLSSSVKPTIQKLSDEPSTSIPDRGSGAAKLHPSYRRRHDRSKPCRSARPPRCSL